MMAIGTQITAFLMFAGLLAAPASVRAAQSYDACTGFITSLPTTINTQGVWCFNKNLDTAITSGNAITIATNNVTIDCNDFKLGGLAAGAGTQANGIRASARLNATVRNCNIRGFLNGVVIDGAGHTVVDNRFDGNTYIGLYVGGDGSLIQRNRVNTTGGSTYRKGSAYGIYSERSVDLLDNSVDGVQASDDGSGSRASVGIKIGFNPDGSLIGNRVRGLAPDGGGSFGISTSSFGRVTLERNYLVGPGTFGIVCNDRESAKDNIVSGFSTGLLTDCGDAGGNYINSVGL